MDEIWDTGAPPGDGASETAALSGSEGAQEQPGAPDMSEPGALPGLAAGEESFAPGGEEDAHAALERNGAAFARELEAIRALDPDVRGFSDLPKMASFPRFIELAQRGCGFVDAFRAANFDAIVERRAGAARQAALNEMRSTRRFEPVGGAAEPASDLTQEEMDWWKAFGFSEKKARYYHNKYKKER